MLDWFKKYIDDVLSLFRGDREQAKWCISILNSICPGVVEFTLTFSTTSIIFLNTRLILNWDLKHIDVDYYEKPINKQLFLHYRSCHHEHVFRATVHGQALIGKTVCSYPEWCDIYLQKLLVKFLEQEYPESFLMSNLRKPWKKQEINLFSRRRIKTK